MHRPTEEARTSTRTAALAMVALFCTLCAASHEARAERSGKSLAEVKAAFAAYSGAQLVFARADLPRGQYYDRMPGLQAAERVKAARIALREVRKYPRGFLGDMGLQTVGIFDALVADKGDGFRPYDKRWRGYLYYGLWNGENALVAAFYTDGQLPLTLHHEIFHHVDGTRAGRTSYKRYFRADDQRFQAAVAGTQRYSAPDIAAADLQKLRKRGRGALLRTTVSGYAAKGSGEDQAETARHFMTNLADSLVQVATRPRLAGSQRLLHVMAQYQRALALGPDAQWFVDVALGRTAKNTRAQLRASLDQQRARLRKRLRPSRGDTEFAVWGGEDEHGVNWTLRADIDRIGRDALRLARLAEVTPSGSALLRPALLRNARLLSRYYQYIDARWTVTTGTRQTFDRARAAIIASLPAGDRKVRARLQRASYASLADHISAAGQVRGALAGAAHRNPHLKNVDAEIAEPRLRAAIRGVQPATVRFGNGSGVNIAARGLILTAAHVVDRKGASAQIEFPDGRTFTGVVTAFHKKYDLALVELSGASGLPVARVADAAPRRGSRVVIIGQPGRRTPSGTATGYRPWHVSVGTIRGFLKNRLGAQSLGRTKHDAWTYWGHSGSPLFDDEGAIVALHNSWDSKTAMRHAVTWEAIVDFLKRADEL